MLNIQGKIIVLYGGPSAESAVSKMSAEGVYAALLNIHDDVELLEYTQSWISDLQKINPSFVFNAMHGCPGEDGRVQAVLEELNIPYQGSGVEASVKAMDKSIAKKEFVAADMDVAKGEVYEAASLPKNLPFYPAFVKPNRGGSSVGAYMVENEKAWKNTKAKIMQDGGDVLAEEFIRGKELTVAVMGEKPLGIIEMRVPEGGFFDYESKYTKGITEYIYPAPIATEVYSKAEKWAVKAHKVLGCKGVTRVDFMYNEEQNRLVLMEVNTLPGMTSTSLVPKAAKACGYSYEQLIAWMINEAI